MASEFKYNLYRENLQEGNPSYTLVAHSSGFRHIVIGSAEELSDLVTAHRKFSTLMSIGGKFILNQDPAAAIAPLADREIASQYDLMYQQASKIPRTSSGSMNP